RSGDFTQLPESLRFKLLVSMCHWLVLRSIGSRLKVDEFNERASQPTTVCFGALSGGEFGGLLNGLRSNALSGSVAAVAECSSHSRACEGHRQSMIFAITSILSCWPDRRCPFDIVSVIWNTKGGTHHAERPSGSQVDRRMAH